MSDLEKGITLKDLLIGSKKAFHFLRRKMMLIVLFGLIGAALGFSYAYLKKPIYTATLSFALEDEKSGAGGTLGGALGLASQLGFDLGGTGGSAFSGANLIELMKTRFLIEKTLLHSVTLHQKTETLADAYLDYNDLRKKWSEDPSLANMHFAGEKMRSTFTLKQDSVLGLIYRKIIKDNLSVAQKDKKVSIIDVNFYSENELFAKYFVEVLAAEVSEFYIETKTKKTASNVAILQKQVDSIRGELNGAISGVATATDNTFNLNPALNIRRVPSQKRQVDVQANSAILVQLVQNLALSEVALRKETPLIQIVDAPILPLQKTKTSKLVSLILGGAIFSICTILFLVIKRFLQNAVGEMN